MSKSGNLSVPPGAPLASPLPFVSVYNLGLDEWLGDGACIEESAVECGIDDRSVEETFTVRVAHSRSFVSENERKDIKERRRGNQRAIDMRRMASNLVNSRKRTSRAIGNLRIESERKECTEYLYATLQCSGASNGAATTRRGPAIRKLSSSWHANPPPIHLRVNGPMEHQGSPTSTSAPPQTISKNFQFSTTQYELLP